MTELERDNLILALQQLPVEKTADEDKHKETSSLYKEHCDSFEHICLVGSYREKNFLVTHDVAANFIDIGDVLIRPHFYEFSCQAREHGIDYNIHFRIGPICKDLPREKLFEVMENLIDIIIYSGTVDNKQKAEETSCKHSMNC